MTHQRVLLVAACVCFAIALLSTVGAITAATLPWELGGFLALALSFAV